MSKSAHALHDEAVQQLSEGEVSFHEAELHEVEDEPTTLDLVVVGVVLVAMTTAPIWVGVLVLRNTLKQIRASR